jgi:YD repeat-containing protein
MNNEGALSANTDDFGRVTTFCYDAAANCVRIDEKASGPVLAADGRTIKPVVPPQGTAVPRKPFLTHTFEFRLSGSEMQEQVVPLSRSKSWAAGGVLAIERVRTYLTR